MADTMSWLYFGWLISQCACLTLLFVIQSKLRKGETLPKWVYILCTVFCAGAFVFILAILVHTD